MQVPSKSEYAMIRGMYDLCSKFLEMQEEEQAAARIQALWRGYRYEGFDGIRATSLPRHFQHEEVVMPTVLADAFHQMEETRAEEGERELQQNTCGELLGDFKDGKRVPEEDPVSNREHIESHLVLHRPKAKSTD